MLNQVWITIPSWWRSLFDRLTHGNGERPLWRANQVFRTSASSSLITSTDVLISRNVHKPDDDPDRSSTVTPVAAISWRPAVNSTRMAYPIQL
jgi:hypothetical protein